MSPRLVAGPIALDEAARSVTVDGRTVDLSPREFSLLECLLRHAGQTLSRDQLLDQAWPFSVAVTPNAVDAYVHYLRTKLGPAGSWIETVRGVGYRLRGADPSAPAATDAAADPSLAADARLIRRVRLRLIAWSGLSTMVVLLVLGIAMYAIVARTLEAAGTAQLEARRDEIEDALQSGGPDRRWGRSSADARREPSPCSSTSRVSRFCRPHLRPRWAADARIDRRGVDGRRGRQGGDRRDRQWDGARQVLTERLETRTSPPSCRSPRTGSPSSRPSTR